MAAVTRAFKVTTHDLRPPIQGGDPIWDGTVPFRLPRRRVDRGEEECAAGWNACWDLATALKIAGVWPGGWPCRAWRVETKASVVERGLKLRASTWTVIKECSEQEIETAIANMSVGLFESYAKEMTAEHLKWRSALARPQWDESAVRDGLMDAIMARGLNWTLKKYESADSIMNAYTDWEYRSARSYWKSWIYYRVQDYINIYECVYRPIGELMSRPAWDSVIYHFKSLLGEVKYFGGHYKYTVGIRDAYTYGLLVAVPTEPGTLGYVMV